MPTLSTARNTLFLSASALLTSLLLVSAAVGPLPIA
jgi:hypothetical protein